MFDNSITAPVKVAMQPISAGERIRSGSLSCRKGVDIRGKILGIRRGRQRPRRYSPVAYGGVNRRHPNDQRRSLKHSDRNNDRVVTLLVPDGVKLDKLVGKNISLVITA